MFNSIQRCDGYFLECGLTLKLDSIFDTFRWLGEGPFTYTPGKTMYNKRNCWALHKNDLRFIGNRGLVDIAVATDKQRGIGLWSDNGNIGVENINGSIYISQNAIVTGYGSKFTAPQKRKTMDNLKEIRVHYYYLLTILCIRYPFGNPYLSHIKRLFLNNLI